MASHYIDIDEDGATIYIEFAGESSSETEADNTCFASASKDLANSLCEIMPDLKKCAEKNIHNAFAYKDFFSALEDLTALASKY